MKAELIKKEGNVVNFKLTIDNDKFEAAINKAYNKNKGRFNIAGFRKGKAPRRIIENNYGKGVFYEDAIDIVFPEVYPSALDELQLAPIDRPSIDVEEISKDNGLVLVVQVEVQPEFELGQYKGIEVAKVDYNVTDEEVDAKLNELQEKASRLVDSDKEIENGDTANIDFEGFKDDVAFEGGKAEGHNLVIGSGSFIPGFEDQLIGKKAGEEVDVNVTFPADYHAEELAGAPVVFKVKVKEIQRKELPEANDDFASEVSDFDTMEEYKKDLTEKLQAEKIEAAKTADEDKVVAKVIENATMEIPDQMVEEQVNGMVNDYARRLESQGISFKQYVEITGMTAEKIGEQMKPQAIKRIQTRLVLEAVVKAENIQADDAAVEEQFDKMAEDFKMDKEQIKGMFGEEQIAQLKEDLAVQKAIDFLVAEAKFVD